MRTIKATTKRGQQFVKAYESSKIDNLRQCYKKMSWEKIRAEALCIKKAFDENGWNFKILSYNKFQFTCGWQTYKGLRIETANNSYLITEE